MIIRPEFSDMWRLLMWLTSATEPLLIIVAVYLAAMFALSKTGQLIGSQKWLKYKTIWVKRSEPTLRTI